MICRHDLIVLTTRQQIIHYCESFVTVAKVLSTHISNDLMQVSAAAKDG
jgi:hypothetical protein